MTRRVRLLLMAACAWGAHGATRSLPTGDAARGQSLFHEKACLQCHSVNGKGGGTAPDLARAVTRGYSPANLASALWNHAPGMSAAWAAKGMRRPDLTEQDAADLFAYFYAARYFEGPGNARRGRGVFTAKGCAACHGVTSAVRKDAPPVAAWAAVADPVALGARLWNHGAPKREAASPYSNINAVELADLLAFARSHARHRTEAREFAPGSPEKGRAVLASKRCATCHVGARDLEERPTRYTLMDFLAGMWHRPDLWRPASPPMTRAEMADLAAYLLATQFGQERGDAMRGQTTYTAKGCAGCHDQAASGAPPRAGMLGRMNSYSMISSAWRHGPAMQERLRARNLAWPKLDPTEMADLLAFLNGQRLRQRPGAR